MGLLCKYGMVVFAKLMLDAQGLFGVGALGGYSLILQAEVGVRKQMLSARVLRLWKRS